MTGMLSEFLTNEILLIGILIGIIIGFILGFLGGLWVKKKITIKRQEIFGSIFFIIWITMHIYGFIHNLDVPMIFDIVGAGSAGAILGLEVSQGFTNALLSKIGQGKKK